MDNSSIYPTCWGPAMWFFLHSMSCAYDPQKDHEYYYSFFTNLGNVLPCSECKKHYKQNMDPDELSIALVSTENMFKFVYDLHNKVNKQTGIPESKWPSYKSVKEKFTNFKVNCGHTTGTCGTGSSKPPKKMKMVEHFGIVSQDQIPCLCVIGILIIIIAILLINCSVKK